MAGIVTAGTIEDIFDAEARIWMVFAWGCAANLGLVFGPFSPCRINEHHSSSLGPIYGSFISETLGW